MTISLLPSQPALDPISSLKAITTTTSIPIVDHPVGQVEENVHELATIPALHTCTPLFFSRPLSERTGHNVWIKADAFQPSGSFKIRGIGRVCQLAYSKYGSRAHLVASSGGNAGLAAATAAKAMKLRCTVFTPSTTEVHVVQLLRDLGALVHHGGASWDDVDIKARELVDSEESAVYIHPFEGEELVDGHKGIVHEIRRQLNGLPDVISCSVGGGGLLRGIMRGISEVEDEVVEEKGKEAFLPPRLIATQDFGADAFSSSWNAGDDKQVVLDAITSKATSLGLKRCSSKVLIEARSYARYEKNLTTLVISDDISASACWQFKRDHQIMVELSCGAALTPVYFKDRILSNILGTSEGRKKDVVLIACGGSKVDQEMISSWESEYGTTGGTAPGMGRIQVDGVDF
ncbi:tryptophan synthase beta subunit-like PLP-dependent enzyme [Violaceomyces palustris]|uniref:Tryptophan synthase beta subunit-like PLP-dependent enzyme n=1 Tax=Violaceomyces palustris TaxID=1673888 RepID=A0ACD0NRB7_9BASI|nr:tryptophan synthase beta subunit-like PLP-dependent enzyme [Violaceomyces palustris]